MQDIPDAILGRPTRPTLPASYRPGHEAIVNIDMDPHVDEVYVILIEGDFGVQPLIWPMDTHHPQDPDKRTDH